jgi:hypothetical protein
VQNEKEADAAVVKSTDAAPISASAEDRAAAEAEAEEKLRLEGGFKPGGWPPPADRQMIRLCAEQFVRLGRQAEEDALKQNRPKFHFLAVEISVFLRSAALGL